MLEEQRRLHDHRDSRCGSYRRSSLTRRQRQRQNLQSRYDAASPAMAQDPAEATEGGVRDQCSQLLKCMTRKGFRHPVRLDLKSDLQMRSKTSS